MIILLGVFTRQRLGSSRDVLPQTIRWEISYTRFITTTFKVLFSLPHTTLWHQLKAPTVVRDATRDEYLGYPHSKVRDFALNLATYGLSYVATHPYNQVEYQYREFRGVYMFVPSDEAERALDARTYGWERMSL